MKVKDYISETLQNHKMHMTLIDPVKQEPESAGDIARKVCKLGTDALMVGGSTGITQENLDNTVDSIKQVCRLPVIYFPSGANAIAQKCDAIYFMSMLNSLNVKNITGEHWKGAPIIKKLGLEAISMGYVIIEPGMKVGEVGEADLVRRDDVERVVGYALTTELFGMDLLYLEAGSGAPEPVPANLVRAASEAVDIPLVVGGGVVSADKAKEVAQAGADIVVTGTLVENGAYEKKLKEIIRTVHKV